MSWSDAQEMKVFAGRHSIELAKSVCRHLDMPLGEARTDVFPDGELIVTIEEDVRGRDCFVLLSTCRPVNDNLMELLIFGDTLRRASAKRITAVIPYFGYARQDRKDRGRTPITAKLAANLITTAGYDRVVAMELHSAQIQGFFDIPVDHLPAVPVLGKYLQNVKDEYPELVIVSPDVGNMKVADMYKQLLGTGLAVIDKQRMNGSDVKISTIVGDVEGKPVLLIDDMISTAGTLCEAAKILEANGATEIIAAATHPLLVGPAIERLQASPISRIIVTNTIPANDRYMPLGNRIVELNVGELFAEAIHHIHHSKSVSGLFRGLIGTKR
ncbi:MAG: ribose-phosphate pyrophosphokinase [Planctomycetota bacterium]